MIDARESIQDKVITFLRDEILFDKEQNDVTASEPLFNGLLDSLGTLRLVVFLEETFGIQVADGELVPENFESVERIATYVAKKKA